MKDCMRYTKKDAGQMKVKKLKVESLIANQEQKSLKKKLKQELLEYNKLSGKSLDLKQLLKIKEF